MVWLQERGYRAQHYAPVRPGRRAAPPPAVLAGLAVVVLAVLVVLAALLGQARGPEVVTTASGRGDATAAPVPSAPPLAVSFLVPPAPFAALNGEAAGAVARRLQAVVRPGADGPAAERAALARLGVTGTGTRAWQGAGDVMLVVAHEFADERGASTYVGEAVAVLAADPETTTTPLPGVPGAAAFRLPDPGPPGQVALLARGTRAYSVVLVGPSAADPQAALLARLVADQYEAAL